MVQVDLEQLRNTWYTLGSTGKNVTGDNVTLFNSLDAWQRKELVDAYTEGQKAVQWQA